MEVSDYMCGISTPKPPKPPKIAQQKQPDRGMVGAEARRDVDATVGARARSTGAVPLGAPAVDTSVTDQLALSYIYNRLRSALNSLIG